jgi:serine/threonine protein kinase
MLERHPKLYFIGTEGDFNVLIIELCDPSLKNLRTYCGGSFTMKTTLLLTMQMVDRIENFYKKGLLHRDIKPDNFLMGSKHFKSTLFIVDFGLAKAFRYRTTGEHISFRKNKGVTGTVRYCSISTHLGYEISRRDDLESIMYVAVYLFNGFLPWMNYKQNFTDRN